MLEPRIVQFAGYSAPYASSFVFMQRALLTRALARGWRAEIVFEEEARGRPWLDDVAGDGIGVHLLPVGSRLRLRRGIEELLGEPGEPTLLHTHYTHFDIAAALAGRRRPQTTVVWHIRTALSPARSARLRNRAKFALLGREVERIYCNAPNMADEVKERGAPPDKVEFIPNPIDVGRFPPTDAAARRAARAAYGLPQDVPLLLHFGWLWHIKGGDLFLRGVRRLVDAGEEIAAVTVGGGEPALALRDELGLQDHVTVLPFQEQVQTLYAAADLFVACSRMEGMTFSMAEAFCSGLPVVATDIPGQAIQAPGLGARRLIPLDDEALAEGVRSLLARDPATVVADREAARAWVEEHQGVGPWSERLLDAYASMLAGGR